MRLLALACVFAGAAVEAGPVQAIYACERGVEIPLTYFDDAGAGFAIAQIEGRQVLLEQVRSGSGAFYAEGGETGSGYFWMTKGDAATLLWREAAAADRPLLSACEARN